MTATTIPTTGPTTGTADREAARRARVESIRSGALVRIALGQAATYRRLPDGRHEITLAGKSTIGATLAEAIDAARREVDQ